MSNQFQASVPSTKFIGTICQIGLDQAHLEERRRESALCLGFRTRKDVLSIRDEHQRAVEDSVDAEPCCPQWGSQVHHPRSRVELEDRRKPKSWKKHRRNRWSKTQIMSSVGTPLTA
ncbi:hypothetical protein K2Q08_00895, partial [Patescibacteria group bacterium]|nr:hypothetical protein [Patescibacteria group bacterium]